MKAGLGIVVFLNLMVAATASDGQTRPGTGGVGPASAAGSPAGIGPGTGIAPGTLGPVHAKPSQDASGQSSNAGGILRANSGGVRD